MECRIDGVLVHWVEHGDGVPLVALHGAGVDHRELAAGFEPVVPGSGYRRIYPDLPGMGRTSAAGLTSNDDVVALLTGFIEQLDIGPVLLAGHSYGAYLARGLAARRPDLVLGLTLFCPVGEQSRDLPDHAAVDEDPAAYDELEPGQRQGFDAYFVVRTPTTARRYRDSVAPATTRIDGAALERIFAGWTVDTGSRAFPAPTLIVAGRQDATAGYAGAAGLLEHYPHGSLAVVDGAGHALLHERPGLITALVGDWLERARSSFEPMPG